MCILQLTDILVYSEANDSLQMASMASGFKFELRFEINNLNYPDIHVYIASNGHFGDLWGHGDLQMASTASGVKFDLGFEISNLNYPSIHMHIASNIHLGDFGGHGSL